jgi:predicted DNA-binding transcriptional regulator AlpA
MTCAAPTFIATAEVAQLLGLSGGNFLRVRPRLEDEAGFPEPMPHSRRPLRWRRDQVLSWIEGQGLPRDTESTVDPALIASGQVVLLAEARRL